MPGSVVGDEARQERIGECIGGEETYGGTTDNLVTSIVEF